jgi:hypothetical protein
VIGYNAAMPVLKNRKHERFAQEMIRGLNSGRTQGMSYRAAGYQVDLPVAEAAASRLLHNVKSGVAARVQELAGGGARRAEITAASVLEKLDNVFLGASQAKQYSAAGRAAEAQARIAGVGAADRIEVNQVGAFAQSTDEVLERVGREMGPSAKAILMWMLDDPDGPMPADDIARTMLEGMTLDQVLARHDLLRQALIRVASDDAQLVDDVARDDPPRDQVDHQALSLLTRPKPRKARR